MKKKSRKLTIYLVRRGMDHPNKIIKEEESSRRLGLSIAGASFAMLYVMPSHAKPPKWAALFDDFIDINELGFGSTASAALLVKVQEDFFVLAFGHGRHLIRHDVCEERFGLVCSLNSVIRESLRCVDIQSLNAIQSQSRIQSSLDVPADQFGLDVEQDMLRAVVGTPSDSNLGARMTGSESLSVSVRMDLSDLPELLSSYRKQFSKDLNATDYAWVNNINLLKRSSSTISTLDSLVAEKFQEERHENLWLAIPEIIDWNNVAGFVFQAGRKAMHPDINLMGFLGTVAEPTDITIDLLRNRSVFCVDQDHNQSGKSWPIYKCLYAEIELEDQKYILNGGSWYRVDADFVSKTNRDFEEIPRSSLSLPPYCGGGEGYYNQTVAATQADRYFLLDDKKKVFHGGGHGQVEICDLFSSNRELIHIKRYGKSSVLSHLFAQGFVSGKLFQLDKEFRRKVAERLTNGFRELVEIKPRPAENSYTVVYGIISESKSSRLHRVCAGRKCDGQA